MALQTNTPTMGIMTRTLVSSSVTHSIIPARIRTAELNDVVFINDDSIELKEYHDDGYLQHVARKSDFGCKILSACCCFEDSSMRVKPEPFASRGIDAIIKPDPDDVEAEIEAIRSDSLAELDVSKGPKLEPPQILALALESGELVFLLAHFNKSRAVVSFVTSSTRRFLYSGGSQATRAGKRMAVDPTSSVLAIAPHEGLLSLFWLKPLIQVHTELRSPSLSSVQFDPVFQEKTIMIMGTILQMGFLYGKQSIQGADDSLVVLIVIASWKGRTKLHRFEWDSGTGIEDFKEVGTGHALSAEEQSPLLLIPTTITSGFLLVCQTRGYLYGDTSPGCWEPPLPQILNDQDLDGADTDSAESSPRESGISHGAPIWAQWTRPIRRRDWFSEHDAIYLCREDGLVKYLFIEANGTRPTIAKSKVGNISTNIDSALACVDNGLGGTWHEDGKESEDVLVTGGSMGDGALYSFKGRQNAIKGQVIPRWAPLLDVCKVPTIPMGVTLQPFQDPQDVDLVRCPQQLFACTGRGARHGAVCELRYGTRASISISYLLSAPDLLGLWAFNTGPHSDYKGENLLLLSGPNQTHLMDLHGDLVLMAEHGLDGASETIAAGCSFDGIYIQITRRSVRAFKEGAKGEAPFREDMDVLAAHVHCFHALALLCIRDGNHYSLKLIQFESEQSGLVTANYIGAPLTLEVEVTSLHLTVEKHCVIALAGNRKHQLQVHLGTLKNGLDETFYRVFSDYKRNSRDPDSGLCESLALIAGPKDANKESSFPGPKYLVLCGLRNGRYEAHVISVKSREVFFEECEVRTMGQTAVKVMPETTSKRRKNTERCHTRALVLCDGILCRVTYSPYLPIDLGATLTRIWLVDNNEPGCRYSNIAAMAQPIYFPNIHTELESKANLFCVEGGNVHCADLDLSSEPQILPRKLTIGGTPSRIMYSQHLRKLIVGFSKTVVKNIPGQKSRLHFPMAAIVDPFQDFSSTAPEVSLAASHLMAQNIGKSGEKILGIHEWSMAQHHAVVIHTIRNRKGGKAPTGRILIYYVEINKDALELKEKVCLKQPAPVYALAVYDQNSIVHCTGERLVKHQKELGSDGVTWKIHETAASELPSFGVSISVAGGRAFVSTKAHSTIVYNVEDDSFIPIMSDQAARNISTHLLRESAPLMHVANPNGTLAGLRIPSLTVLNRSFINAYEAKLPMNITRLLAGHLQPLWCREYQGDGKLTLASSLNGTIYQVHDFHKSSATCLKFIQNLVERVPGIGPASPLPHQRQQLMPLPNDALHVDADVLARFLRHSRPGPELLLRKLVEQPWEESESWDPLHDPAKRVSAFKELVDEMRSMRGGEGWSHVQWVVGWIAKFIRAGI